MRPSYVLGGRAMEVVFNEEDLRTYMTHAVKVSNDSPVLLDRFLDVAIEVDVDACCDGEDVLIGGIMEHVEQAGVHSGDSGCSLPPNSLSPEIQAELREQTRKLAKALYGHRADEHPVRDPERHHLRPRGESARLAHRAVRLQGHGRAARQDRRARDDRQEDEEHGERHRGRAAVLLGEGSRVPVHQVPGSRSDPRARR